MEKTPTIIYQRWSKIKSVNHIETLIPHVSSIRLLFIQL
jgi:hypothetical protein